jgi:glycosyltransferase involved in cell wall biosynthesis
MKLSLAITTYNRLSLTIESFAQVIDDERINDIVVLDDASTDGSHKKLVEYYKDVPKVRLIRQSQNRGMSVTKRDAISLCRNTDVVIFDSDNKLGKDYLNALEAVGEFSENTLYLPVAANPRFDYTKFSGLTITASNIGEFMSNEMFRCALNTCNCLVNRDYYTKTFIEDPKIGCADTINHIYNHMKSGGELFFVPGMEYFHLVGPQSGFLENADYNIKKAKEIEQKISML